MEEAVLQELEISGVRVLKVKKGQQIVYKLANNVSVTALPEGKRNEIMQTIMRLHAQDTRGIPMDHSVVYNLFE